MTISNKFVTLAALVLASLTLTTTANVHADTNGTSNTTVLTAVSDATSTLTKAYETRDKKDIETAKSEIDALKDSALQKELKANYNNLTTFLSEINVATSATKKVEATLTREDLSAAIDAVNALDAAYQTNDYKALADRVTKAAALVKDKEAAAEKAAKEKAEADAKAKAEAEAKAQAEADRLAAEKAAQEAAKAEADAKAKAEADAAIQATQATQAAQPAQPQTSSAQNSSGSYATHNGFSAGSAKEAVAMTESGGSYAAQNGQYYGRYQLSSSYLGGDFSPANQERVADSYVAGRYGSWDAAWAFHQAHGWY